MPLAALPGSTTKQEALAIPSPALPITGETAGALAGSSLIMALVIMWLRRRLSRDGSQIMQDRAEGVTVKTLLAVNEALIAENERLKKDARDAWATRTNDAAEIAMLRERNQHLQTELDRLRPAVSAAVSTAVHALNELSDSGVVPLIDLKQPKGKK